MLPRFSSHSFDWWFWSWQEHIGKQVATSSCDNSFQIYSAILQSLEYITGLFLSFTQVNRFVKVLSASNKPKLLEPPKILACVRPASPLLQCQDFESAYSGNPSLTFILIKLILSGCYFVFLTILGYNPDLDLTLTFNHQAAWESKWLVFQPKRRRRTRNFRICCRRLFQLRDKLDLLDRRQLVGF